MSNEIAAPALPEVIAQEAKLVGDENMPDPRKAEVTVNSEPVAAQVMQVAEPASATIPVHEVSVTLETVITDTSDPLAVQVPDAGRGTMELPISALSGDTVEEKFRAAAEAEAPVKKAAAKPAPKD